MQFSTFSEKQTLQPRLLIILYYLFFNLLPSCSVQLSSQHEKNNALANEEENFGKSLTIVFQDSKGNYWFGSDGVFKFDGENLERYSIDDGLHSNRIRDIQEDHLGNIYFDTGEGINKFNGHSFEKITLDTTNTQNWKKKENDIWFAGNWNKNGVYRYDGEILHLLEFPVHPLEEEFFTLAPHASYSPYEVYEIFEDSRENIWMGTSTFGACRFDGNSVQWISEREMTEIEPGPAPGVRSIVEDTNGDFWFSSNINHKYQILQSSRETESHLNYLKKSGIKSNEKDLSFFFQSMVSDDDGNIWMAEYKGGVWKYDGQNLQHYPVSHNETEVFIFSIYKDNENKIWLGSHNSGPFLFEGNKFIKFEPWK